MQKIKYLILFVFFFSAYGFIAPRQAYGHDTILSIGNLCEYIGKIQTDDSGSKNLCQFNPLFSTAFDYQIKPDILLSPELSFTLPKSGRDDHIKKLSITLLVNSKFKLDSLYFIGGAGLFLTRISGPGGDEVLNNGTSSSSFPLPDSSVFIRNFIFNLGIGYPLNTLWSTEVHSYIFNLTSSEDRAFSVAFNLSYHFGEF